MKWIRWVLLKIQSGHDSVHRQTDGQGDTSIPPFQLRWSWGYNNHQKCSVAFTSEQFHAWSAPRHYLNQRWNIVNWTLRNKLQWNFNLTSNIFIHSRNCIWKRHLQNGGHLSQPQCVSKQNFYYLGVEKWQKMEIYFHVFQSKFRTTRWLIFNFLNHIINIMELFQIHKGNNSVFGDELCVVRKTIVTDNSSSLLHEHVYTFSGVIELNSGESWWRHQIETFSALLALCAGNSPVTSEFLAQRPVTQSFDVFFDLRLNEPLSKQSLGWWFEMPSHPLWCHSNDDTGSHWW